MALHWLRSPFLAVLELVILVILAATVVGQCNGGREKRAQIARLTTGLAAAADTIDAAERAIAQRDTALAQLQDSAAALADLRKATRAAAARAPAVVTAAIAPLPEAERTRILGEIHTLVADAAMCDAQRATCEEQRVQKEAQLAIARATLGVVRESLTTAIARADSIRPLTPLQQLWQAKEEAAVLVAGGGLIYLVLKGLR